ncbi:MAG: hypothetical protein HKL82_02885 [Acidimicrobiaceae bacterium]|nr:hypothetical protein [Acidimicrobiaceae bacterium]
MGQQQPSVEPYAGEGVGVVGMNVSYDLKIIDACSKGVLGMSLADAGWSGPLLDILVIDRHFDKYRKGGRKLVDLCSHYGVTAELLHDAENDVEASVLVLFRQCQQYSKLAAMSMDELNVAQQLRHRKWAEGFSKYLVSKGKGLLAESDVNWPLDATEVVQVSMGS